MKGQADRLAADQLHLAALRQHFNAILTNYGRSSQLRAMTTLRLREETEKAIDEARRLGQESPKVGLSNATIRRHMGNLEQFLAHLKASGYALQDLTFKGIKPKKRSASSVRGLTAKPDPEQIRPIFQIPVFTGCAGPLPQAMRLVGNKVYHSSLYYVPMPLTYLGARRAEITGLSINDVSCEDGIWAVYIRKNQLRQIKNSSRIDFCRFRARSCGLALWIMSPA